MDAGAAFSYQYFDNANTPTIDVSVGQLDLGFSRLRDAEDHGFIVRFDASIGLESFLPSQWLADGSADFRYYIAPEIPLYSFGGLRGIAATGQPQIGLEIQSGFGFGRFRDVSPLAMAMTIHRNLRVSKAIRVTLSDRILNQMAQAIDGLSDSEGVDDIITAIEEAIETATGVQLGARALLMIEDVLMDSGISRFCGFSIQAGIGYELLDPYGGPQGFLFVASGDFAYAPDPSGQMQGHISLSGPMNLADENSLSGRFSYEIAVSNTSTIDASYSVQRVKPFGLAPVLTHTLSCEAAFGVGFMDVLLGLTLSRATGDAGWSVGCSVSAFVDLL